MRFLPHTSSAEFGHPVGTRTSQHEIFLLLTPFFFSRYSTIITQGTLNANRVFFVDNIIFKLLEVATFIPKKQPCSRKQFFHSVMYIYACFVGSFKQCNDVIILFTPLISHVWNILRFLSTGHVCPRCMVHTLLKYTVHLLLMRAVYFMNNLTTA